MDVLSFVIYQLFKHCQSIGGPVCAQATTLTHHSLRTEFNLSFSPKTLPIELWGLVIFCWLKVWLFFERSTLTDKYFLVMNFPSHLAVEQPQEKINLLKIKFIVAQVVISKKYIWNMRLLVRQPCSWTGLARQMSGLAVGKPTTLIVDPCMDSNLICMLMVPKNRRILIWEYISCRLQPKWPSNGHSNPM